MGATHEDPPFALAAHAERLLEERAERAAAMARRRGQVAVAAVTVPVPATLDLSAAVLAARRATDRFFCFEQPERNGFVLAGLGEAATVEASGPGRFGETARRVRELASRTVADDPGLDPGRPPAAGPVFVGGFAFAHEGGGSPEWSSLAPATLVLPEVSLARYSDEARMTVCVAAGADDEPEALVRRARERVAELAPATMPLLDPDPVGRARVAGAAAPSHYEAAVGRAVERIAAGELQKIVLAREVRVHGPRDHDPAPVLDALRAALPRLLLLVRGHARAGVRGREPRAARAPRRRARPDGGAGRAPPAAARTPRWTTTWGSSCCRARRTARSRRSWPAASSARSTR